MAFRVDVSPRAFEDLDGIADYITKHGSFDRAQKWFNEMVDAIASLKDMPCRCPVADESEELGREVRFLLHGKRSPMYKVYFSVHEESPASGAVQVFHVRHWAQRGPAADELDQLMEEADSEQEW
jgi:plasmid stabilization system protein ParE